MIDVPIGTAIYVFGITINDTTQFPLIKNQDIVFDIDGVQAGNFSFTPINVSDYRYNVPFFVKDGLSPNQHTLQISLMDNSFVLLDYIVFTMSR